MSDTESTLSLGHKISYAVENLPHGRTIRIEVTRDQWKIVSRPFLVSYGCHGFGASDIHDLAQGFEDVMLESIHEGEATRVLRKSK
jgi:hypothetical protein